MENEDEQVIQPLEELKTSDQVVEPESKETEVEPEPTAKEAYDLAQALQKGYTLTRQDMAAIRDNQTKIQEALDAIKKGQGGEFDDGGEDQPLTVKGYLDLQRQQYQAKEQEDTRLNQQIDRQLDELRIQGIVKTVKDEQELLDFAVKRKLTNLSDAAGRWNEIKEAKKEGMREGMRGNVKIEAGSKIGTSQKSQSSKEGFDYGEIHSKSMEELAYEGE